MANIPQRVRYEVLRRDGYRCYYCGATAADAKLTVDAVVPEALGGSHKDPANLVTACGPCNGGKTSSSPDAPLVAAVAEDAARWAQAMRVAQEQMLANIKGREAAQEQFRQWWDAWGYGEGDDRQLIPKDPNWRYSVDQLTSAGLPLQVLKDCIDRAMTRKNLQPENTFRYMCGVAWRKITELQEAARQVANGKPAPAAGEGDAYDQGRGDFARELLSELSNEEREYFLAQADMSEYQEDDDEPQTETQQACEAIGAALNSVRCEWDYLAQRVEETLNALPDGIGARALAPRKDRLGELSGPYGRRTFRLTDALIVADDLLNLPAAREHLSAMTEAERTEWHAFAAALYHRANLDEDQLTSRAWQCAQTIAEGRRWDCMCIGAGEAIPVCPRRGTNHARIAGASCCEPGGPEGHKGHPVCDHHLEELIEGTFAGKSGETFSATDYTAVGSDPWDF